MTPPLYAAVLSSLEAAWLPPTSTVALSRLHFRSPEMPNGLTYALLPDLAPATKAAGFPSLGALARRIHRDRRQDALELRPASVRFRDKVRPVTEVLAVEEPSGATRRIGFAWVAGADHASGRLALQRALDAEVPNAKWEG